MRRLAVLSAILGVLACSPGGERQTRVPETKASEPQPSATPAPAGPASFVNRVWQVAESSGMTPGQLVVFLSEGTLVFASPHETPALGTWTHDGQALTMVEEGISYPTDIVSLSPNEFKIRSHNPGGVVETRFVPAATDQPARP